MTSFCSAWCLVWRPDASIKSYAKELFKYVNESKENGKVKEPKTVLAKKEVSIGNDSF